MKRVVHDTTEMGRRMKKRIIIVLIILVVAGCAIGPNLPTAYYSKSNFDAEQFFRDKNYCEMLAIQGTPDNMFANTTTYLQEGIPRLPNTSKYEYKTVTSCDYSCQTARENRKRKLNDTCLKSKGYHIVSPERACQKGHQAACQTVEIKRQWEQEKAKNEIKEN